MIGALVRSFDNLLGRGEAAVTVPPLDGALRPNRRLDEAAWRTPLPDVDCLAVVAGELLASAGNAIHVLDGGTWRRRREYGSAIACIAPAGPDALAVALDDGSILVEGGRFDGRTYKAAPEVRCPTAITATAEALYLANGSATRSAADWQRDLLERNASGSVWRIGMDDGSCNRIAGGLAYPAGLSVDGDGLVVSESWRHRLVRIDASGRGTVRVLYADLPGYPGRLAPEADGCWLAVFAPRSQLVELVLREPAYRNRMVAEVPQPFWIAPKLRSGRSFYEPLQGGAVKHLGLLKPWAPTMSAGLCVWLDGAYQPRFSLHSRADGATHGVTGVVRYGTGVYVAARGDGVVVSTAAADPGGEA